jgi:hypothetical protein
MVLQGPTWFRSDGSKLRFEPCYRGSKLWVSGNSRNSHEFREFARPNDTVPSVWLRLVLRLSWERCFAAAEE